MFATLCSIEIYNSRRAHNPVWGEDTYGIKSSIYGPAEFDKANGTITTTILLMDNTLGGESSGAG